MIKQISAFAIATVLHVGAASAQEMKAFEVDEDVAFAMKLWTVLESEKFVGPNRIHAQPFEGNPPHGGIQQVLGTDVNVDGRTVRVLVKANHGGEGISVESVYDNSNKNLGAYTVMFKRENGYDDENQNWFWAKYNAKGELDKNPKGAKIAGHFVKGAEKGCIACHTATGGADLKTLTEK